MYPSPQDYSSPTLSSIFTLLSRPNHGHSALYCCCFFVGNADVLLVVQIGRAARLHQATQDPEQAAQEALGPQPLPPHPPVAVGRVGFLIEIPQALQQLGRPPRRGRRGASRGVSSANESRQEVSTNSGDKSLVVENCCGLRQFQIKQKLSIR